MTYLRIAIKWQSKQYCVTKLNIFFSLISVYIKNNGMEQRKEKWDGRKYNEF